MNQSLEIRHQYLSLRRSLMIARILFASGVLVACLLSLSANALYSKGTAFCSANRVLDFGVLFVGVSILRSRQRAIAQFVDDQLDEVPKSKTG